MYVPNIIVGRYVAAPVVQQLTAMDTNTARDGNHCMKCQAKPKRAFKKNSDKNHSKFGSGYLHFSYLSSQFQ